jgi:hypothetical protein
MIEQLLQQFISYVAQEPHIELYNEAGLQHELALFLRSKLEKHYKVQLERNIAHVAKMREGFKKKEMDIYIESGLNLDERYCIELKVSFGRAVGTRILQVHEDIYFLEQLKKQNFRECYLIFATPSKKYMETKPGRLKMYETFSAEGIKIDHLHNNHVSPSYRNNKGDYVYKYDELFVKHYEAKWQHLKSQVTRQLVNEEWKCAIVKV